MHLGEPSLCPSGVWHRRGSGAAKSCSSTALTMAGQEALGDSLQMQTKGMASLSAEVKALGPGHGVRHATSTYASLQAQPHCHGLDELITALNWTASGFFFLLVSNGFCLCQESKSLCRPLFFSENVSVFSSLFFFFFCKISALWLRRRNHCGESISWNDDGSRIIFLCRKQGHLKTGLASLFFVPESVNAQAPRPLILPHFAFWRWVLQRMKHCAQKFFSENIFSVHSLLQSSYNLQEDSAIHSFSSSIFIFQGHPRAAGLCPVPGISFSMGLGTWQGCPHGPRR